MTRFILATVAVALSIFIVFAYQLKAEKVMMPPAPVIMQGPEMPNVQTHKQKPIPPVVREPRTYGEALQLSKQTGKKVVLYFTAPAWCPPCQQMERFTLPSAKVRAAIHPYIFYKIDLDGPEKVVAQRWKVATVPTYVITDETEQAVKIGTGFRTPEAFVVWINSPAQVMIVPMRTPVRTAIRATTRAVVQTVAAPVRFVRAHRPRVLAPHCHVAWCVATD